MKKLSDLMHFYSSQHKGFVIKMTHFIGVPLIVLSIQIALSLINIYFPWLVFLLLIVFYLFLDMTLGIISALFLLMITLTATCLTKGQFSWSSFGLFLLLFISGWILQLIGHRFEGNRPAFMTSLSQIFIAPIFLIAELCFFLGYKR